MLDVAMRNSKLAKKDFKDAREEVTAVEKELKEAENRFKWGSRAL